MGMVEDGMLGKAGCDVLCEAFVSWTMLVVLFHGGSLDVCYGLDKAGCDVVYSPVL